ncbi:DUF2334 domain-containing protein [Clostridium swellfunianum]|uniref:DUF2334 domain-containing protein n=1 Tax=Clostridium swellfunianum TaxID=1367462 RepID=UPI00202FB34E|nr:DUF2334 domain-containing protein [Clostridium swellfunianum]MCM0650881.1 DUF2334 domain-containing protein [Clostridium swellfunianum]
MKKVLKLLTIFLMLTVSIFSANKLNKIIKTNSVDKNTILASFHSSKSAFNSKRFRKDAFSQMQSNIVKDVNIFIDNKDISSKDLILCNYNRYYFKVSDIETVLNCSIKLAEDTFSVYKDNSKSERSYIHPYLTYDNTPYISMIDLTESLGLTLSWDYESKTLRFYKLKSELSRQSRKQYKKPALIRLEDITAGLSYKKSDNLQKLRIMSDLMYSRDLPFHIAWIPRYLKPSSNIDNDLLKVYSLSNVDFVYTLDYMTAKGGIIGLHGYSHQYDDTETCVGSEFGRNPKVTPEYTKERVELAINTAKQLDIPFEFFESPHYNSTKEQQQVIEKYFDYMYEPAKNTYNTMPILSKGNNKTIYVPTPLGYVQNESAESIIKRINSKPKDHVASFFYHPYIEFDYIKLLNKDGYPEYDYSESSILKQILKALDAKGFSPVKITDIKIS